MSEYDELIETINMYNYLNREKDYIKENYNIKNTYIHNDVEFEDEKDIILYQQCLNLANIMYVDDLIINSLFMNNNFNYSEYYKKSINKLPSDINDLIMPKTISANKMSIPLYFITDFKEMMLLASSITILLRFNLFDDIINYGTFYSNCERCAYKMYTKHIVEYIKGKNIGCHNNIYDINDGISSFMNLSTKVEEPYLYFISNLSFGTKSYPICFTSIKVLQQDLEQTLKSINLKMNS